MKYLLDTHILLWAMYEPKKLSQTSQKILSNNHAQKFVSIASLWEISIKSRIGKLPIVLKMSEFINKITILNIGIVGINQQHIEAFNTLPLLHRDPFDGIIISTTLVEKMTLITADENIHKYDVPWIL